MFRKRHRHVHARPNEWVHVHRNNHKSSPSGDTGTFGAIAIAIGGAFGVLIIWEIICWIWGLFVAAIPFLLVSGILVLIGYGLIRNKKS